MPWLRAPSPPAALVAGDSQLAQRQVDTMAHDMRRSMRLLDARRRIDRRNI
jgi:hypothetical protein